MVNEFWETMDAPGAALVALYSKLAVPNYPRRKVSDAEKALGSQVAHFRQVELLEDKWFNGPDVPSRLKHDKLIAPQEFASGEETYVVNWWSASGSNDITQLMYPPFGIFTPVRRKVQHVLLERYATQIRDQYTTRLEAISNDKLATIDQIKERINRIRTILGELQIKEKVPEPTPHPLEQPKSVLDVKDEEISATKYLSPEEKKRLEEAAAVEAERARKRAENDKGVRALNQMMGGTLKTKKDLSPLEIVLEREEWMDTVPPEDFTENQQKLMAEYEERHKQLVEEQDKYRKLLDTELRRLRQEIQEIGDAFDAKLKDEHHERYRTDMKVFMQELYSIRLHLALLQHSEDLSIAAKMRKDLAESKAAEATASNSVKEVEAEVRKIEKSIEEKFRKEKEITQHFRSTIQQEVEADAMPNLNKLFKIRSKPREGPTKTPLSSAMGKDLRGNDPYPDEGVPDQAPPPLVEEHTEDMNLPGYQRTMELRRERWAVEDEIRQLTAVKEEADGLLTHRQQAHQVEVDKLKGIEQELNDHLSVVADEQFDIELLFFLKQGQVEVPQAAVVTDYADAIVVDKTVVEQRNTRIREIAKEKVNSLHTVKDFRKRLSELDWQHKMLVMRTDDLEERTKDVHMLRVTKDLQSLLHGAGEDSRAKAEAELLERKIAHLYAAVKRKEENLSSTFNGYDRAVKMKQRENAMLAKKLGELQQNVMQREHIRRLRAPAGGGGQGGQMMSEKGKKRQIIGGGFKVHINEAEAGAAMSQFRELKLRRQIMDAAKKHTEEIDLLRKELDRLRQRTFPSFVRLHERAPAAPDQR
jgi:hypothetical protein